jgi:hypothetical protein
MRFNCWKEIDIANDPRRVLVEPVGNIYSAWRVYCTNRTASLVMQMGYTSQSRESREDTPAL